MLEIRRLSIASMQVLSQKARGWHVKNQAILGLVLLVATSFACLRKGQPTEAVSLSLVTKAKDDRHNLPHAKIEYHEGIYFELQGTEERVLQPIKADKKKLPNQALFGPKQVLKPDGSYEDWTPDNKQSKLRLVTIIPDGSILIAGKKPQIKNIDDSIFSFVRVANGAVYAFSDHERYPKSNKQFLLHGRLAARLVRDGVLKEPRFASVGEFQLSLQPPHKIFRVTNKSGHFIPSDTSNFDFFRFIRTKIKSPIVLLLENWSMGAPITDQNSQTPAELDDHQKNLKKQFERQFHEASISDEPSFIRLKRQKQRMERGMRVFSSQVHKNNGQKKRIIEEGYISHDRLESFRFLNRLNPREFSIQKLRNFLSKSFASQSVSMDAREKIIRDTVFFKKLDLWNPFLADEISQGRLPTDYKERLKILNKIDAKLFSFKKIKKYFGVEQAP